MSWWCKGSTLFRHVRGLGIDSRVSTLFSIDIIVFTLCLPCYSSLLSACTGKRCAPPVCNYSRIMHEKT